MKMNTLTAATLLIAIFFATSALADEKVQWADVPPAVQKTITEYAEGGKIEEIERETKNIGGKKIPTYEADVRKADGSKIEIEVGEDGKLLELDRD
jgi:hypothetical protein